MLFHFLFNFLLCFHPLQFSILFSVHLNLSYIFVYLLLQYWKWESIFQFNAFLPIGRYIFAKICSINKYAHRICRICIRVFYFIKFVRYSSIFEYLPFGFGVFGTVLKKHQIMYYRVQCAVCNMHRFFYILLFIPLAAIADIFICFFMVLSTSCSLSGSLSISSLPIWIETRRSGSVRQFVGIWCIKIFIICVCLISIPLNVYTWNIEQKQIEHNKCFRPTNRMVHRTLCTSCI